MTNPLLPMLAIPAVPFDGEDHLFEVKWDGIRALAASEGGGRWRLWGRAGADYTRPYPELAVLSRLPLGTVVDGELVMLRVGRADPGPFAPAPTPRVRLPGVGRATGACAIPSLPAGYQICRKTARLGR
jgi:ATP-dependent DNA ligase